MPDIQHQVTQYKYITYLHSVLNGNRSHCINKRSAVRVCFGSELYVSRRLSCRRRRQLILKHM